MLCIQMVLSPLLEDTWMLLQLLHSPLVCYFVSVRMLLVFCRWSTVGLSKGLLLKPAV